MIYKYFGIAALVMLFITVFLGLNIRRFGFKIHKFSAFTTLILGLIHFILQKI